jgi:uncharacterized protein YlxW (UPF0749 family)
MSFILSKLRALPSVQVTLAVALLVLGFLIAAQIAAEGPRVRYSTEERTPLIETALGLQSQQEAFQADILALRQRIGTLEAQGSGDADDLRRLYAQLEEARIAAGLIAVSGPGVAFRFEDGTVGGTGVDSLVTARDVRILIQELWFAGAEGVAVNDERIVGTSAVLDIGGSILVNSAYLAPPYTVTAIGPPDLYQRMLASASFVQFVQGRIERSGIQLSVAQPPSVDLPAFAGTVNVQYASPAEEGAQ